MIVRLCRYTDRALVAIASIALTLNGIDRPHDYWAGRGYLVGLSIISLVVFGVLEPFTFLCGRKALRDRDEAWRASLDGLYDAVSVTGMSMHELSLHIWLPRRTWRHPLRGVLKRPISLRVGYNTVNRPLTFSWNKGVVGQCWAQNDEISRDLEHDFQGVNSEQEWKRVASAHPQEFTMGLSYKDFERTKHLRAVAATPIRRKHRFVGCVSLDTSARPFKDLFLALPPLRRLATELGKLDLSRVE